jgi:hypothetical protein
MTGSAKPILISGIRYKSVFSGSLETGLSSNWVLHRTKDSGGKPVIIKGHFVAVEEWFEQIFSQSPWLADALREP